MFRSRADKKEEIINEKEVQQGIYPGRDVEEVAAADRLQPEVADAFALRDGDTHGRTNFKDLGWIKAGIIITCEVSSLPSPSPSSSPPLPRSFGSAARRPSRRLVQQLHAQPVHACADAQVGVRAAQVDHDRRS